MKKEWQKCIDHSLVQPYFYEAIIKPLRKHNAPQAFLDQIVESILNKEFAQKQNLFLSNTQYTKDLNLVPSIYKAVSVLRYFLHYDGCTELFHTVNALTDETGLVVKPKEMLPFQDIMAYITKNINDEQQKVDLTEPGKQSSPLWKNIPDLPYFRALSKESCLQIVKEERKRNNQLPSMRVNLRIPQNKLHFETIQRFLEDQLLALDDEKKEAKEQVKITQTYINESYPLEYEKYNQELHAYTLKHGQIIYIDSSPPAPPKPPYDGSAELSFWEKEASLAEAAWESTKTIAIAYKETVGKVIDEDDIPLAKLQEEIHKRKRKAQENSSVGSQAKHSRDTGYAKHPSTPLPPKKDAVTIDEKNKTVKINFSQIKQQKELQTANAKMRLERLVHAIENYSYAPPFPLQMEETIAETTDTKTAPKPSDILSTLKENNHTQQDSPPPALLFSPMLPQCPPSPETTTLEQKKAISPSKDKEATEFQPGLNWD